MTNEVLPNLVNLQSAVNAALAKLDEDDFAARLWKKDASLFSADPTAQAQIAGRLGWLDLPAAMKGNVPDLLALAQSIKEEGFQQIMLPVLDESSLAPLAFEQALGHTSGFPELTIVNREGAVLGNAPTNTAGPAKTLFVVSALADDIQILPGIAVIFDRVRQELGERTGDNFIAITNPGTALERYARELKFREIFITPPGISGLYLALSYSGLVPAALAGYNVEEMLSRAAIMAEECRKPGLDNPGLHLGSIIGAASVPNRPGTSLLPAPQLEGFGLWVDHLLTEETGRGLLPLDESLSGVGVGDRLIVSLQMTAQKNLPGEKMLRILEETAHPLVRLRLKDMADLAAEFFRWEFAATVAAALPRIKSAP